MRDRFGIDWSNIKGSHFWARPQLSRRFVFSALRVGCRRLFPDAIPAARDGRKGGGQSDWNREERYFHSDGRRPQPL